MAQSPRPCSHCGNTNLCFIPLILDYGVATTLLGATMVKQQKDYRWQVTSVICNQCGYTQLFTANTQDLMQKIPGSTVQTVQPR